MHARIRNASLAIALPLLTSAALAAGHRDWTEIPLGSFDLQGRERDLTVLRPYNRFSVIPEPVVVEVLFDPARLQQRELELSFTVGNEALPPWRPNGPGELYVIGTAAQERLAQSDPPRLTVHVACNQDAERVVFTASGTPDLGQLGADALGPLDELAGKLPSGAFHEYVAAVLQSAGPGLELARGEFERLGTSSDDSVARFARQRLRRIRFAEIEAADSSADERRHYRLGLYAQQVGFYRAARRHFRAAVASSSGVLDRRILADAWYRLSECMARCGDPIEDIVAAAEQAGVQAGVTPNSWDVWVTILRSREIEEKADGGSRRVRAEITYEQVETIKREWGWVQKLVYGASGGNLLLRTRYVEIPDETAVPYGINAGWLFGPLDALLPVRGSVDCVMSFRPRGPSVTGGADCGPNGAALTDIGTWCGWEVYLHEWNHQFDWTVRASEAGDGYPITHHSDSCGHQPIPTMGYGHLASMRYYVTPAMYQVIEPADPDPGAGYIRHWHIGAPLAIDEPPPEEGLPPHRAEPFTLEALRDRPREFLASETDFVDLKRYFANSGQALPPWCVAPATAYVLSPREQQVRLWLGHNDGLVLWLNGELVHRGDYYAIAKWEDADLLDMVAIGATLQKGWNQLDCLVESWPPPRDKGFGFAVRICDFENRLIDDLMVATGPDVRPEPAPARLRQPAPGKFCAWDDVRDDFYHRLPELAAADLARHMGLRTPTGFEIRAEIGATTGYVALGDSSHRTGVVLGGVPIRAVPERWSVETDRDATLNNVLDWNREAVAAYPFQHAGTWRHLLLLRPEAVDAFLTCAQETQDVPALYGSRPLRDRVLGYVKVGKSDGEHEGVRALLVVEAALAEPLPADEEDLLAPGL